MADFRHGIVSSYKRRKCRCAECRAAWNEQCKRNQAAARARRGPLVRQCQACGSDFNPRANQVLCSPECRKAQLGRYGDSASRAAYWGVEFEAIDRVAVFERDGWHCGICGLSVDPQATFPEAGAPTLDHVVPMARGGGHVWANVQLAHFYCNTAKGARELIAC